MAWADPSRQSVIDHRSSANDQACDGVEAESRSGSGLGRAFQRQGHAARATVPADQSVGGEGGDPDSGGAEDRLGPLGAAGRDDPPGAGRQHVGRLEPQLAVDALDQVLRRVLLRGRAADVVDTVSATAEEVDELEALDLRIGLAAAGSVELDLPDPRQGPDGLLQIAPVDIRPAGEAAEDLDRKSVV